MAVRGAMAATETRLDHGQGQALHTPTTHVHAYTEHMQSSPATLTCMYITHTQLLAICVLIPDGLPAGRVQQRKSKTKAPCEVDLFVSART